MTVFAPALMSECFQFGLFFIFYPSYSLSLVFFGHNMMRWTWIFYLSKHLFGFVRFQSPHFMVIVGVHMNWPSAFIHALHIEWFENNVNLFRNNDQILWWLAGCLNPVARVNIQFHIWLSITIYHLLARYWSYFVSQFITCVLLSSFIHIVFGSIELCCAVRAHPFPLSHLCCIISLSANPTMICSCYLSVIFVTAVFMCVCIPKRGHFNYEADGSY